MKFFRKKKAESFTVVRIPKGKMVTRIIPANTLIHVNGKTMRVKSDVLAEYMEVKG